MKKSEFKKNLTKKIALTLGIGMFSIMPMVQALPTGGTSDTATISTSGTTMNISGAANNVINWKGFSIAKGETVAFDANNYLNLVNGPDISNIYGTLKGAGNIFLVNPNGIVFGSGAVINVGSLTASTAPINSVDTTAFLNNGNTASITGSVTGGSDISMALVKVESANSLVLNAGEIVLQNTDVLDKVTQLKGNGNVYIGSADGNLTLNSEQQAKVTGTTANYAGAKLVTDLSTISSDMTGKYLLAGDVDLSSGSFSTLGAAENPGDMTTGFTGYFNGLGYTVSKLSGSNGLFAQIGALDTESSSYNSGTVKNLRLENINITGSGWNGTGALAGALMSGTVSNIYVSGSITAAESFTGGVVGTMGNYTAGFSAMLTNVENTATITGGTSGGDIGGITGMLYGGTITNVKNSGDIDGTYGIGGIVGQTGSADATTIKYAYNTGAIKAVGATGDYAMSGTAGGIIGAVIAPYSGEVPAFTVDNAYSSGTVTGDSVGGIIGTVGSEGGLTITPTVTNSYYANVTNSAGNTYGTSVSASDLQSKAAAIWGGNDSSSDPTPTPSSDPTQTPSSDPTTTPSTDPTPAVQPTSSVIAEIFSTLEALGIDAREGVAVMNDVGVAAKPEPAGQGNSPMSAIPAPEGAGGFGAGPAPSIVENADMSAPAGGESIGSEPQADNNASQNENGSSDNNDNGDNEEENNENA